MCFGQGILELEFERGDLAMFCFSSTQNLVFKTLTHISYLSLYFSLNSLKNVFYSNIGFSFQLKNKTLTQKLWSPHVCLFKAVTILLLPQSMIFSLFPLLFHSSLWNTLIPLSFLSPPCIRSKNPTQTHLINIEISHVHTH